MPVLQKALACLRFQMHKRLVPGLYMWACGLSVLVNVSYACTLLAAGHLLMYLNLKHKPRNTLV